MSKPSSILLQPNESIFQQSIYGTGLGTTSFAQPFSRLVVTISFVLGVCADTIIWSCGGVLGRDQVIIIRVVNIYCVD